MNKLDLTNMFLERNVFVCRGLSVIWLNMFSQVGNRVDALVKRKRGRKKRGTEGRKEGGKEGGGKEGRKQRRKEKERELIFLTKPH